LVGDARTLAALLVLALQLLTTSSARADIESWADRRLTVTHDLALWLDASRQADARRAIGLAPASTGSLIGVWVDGSGHHRSLVQRAGHAQPRIFTSSDKAAVRFDGKDDCFELAGLDQSLDEFTAFILVSPRANPGGFAGILAANAIGRRDYDTGFTIDLGPAPSGRFETLNVEGKGFGGAVDLMNDPQAFSTFHTLEVRARTGRGRVELIVDGRPQGHRDREPGPLRMDEINVGARFYTNEPTPATLRGFLDGDIAEVLIYSRALSDEDCRAVRDYLRQKAAGLDDAVAQATSILGKPLRSVANPPPVQVLVPGFSAERLPLKLKNINNVRYRRDGKLVALAYNGDVFLLTDSDGDGLEDRADLFWDNRGRIQSPIGVALTPPGDPHGNGLYIACKGKCTLIVDTDGDDKADKEIIVATGWETIPHGVDALGVAVATDGSVYFGIGAADFTNAYQLDAQGRARYSLKSERGTILRAAPDFQSREIVATGIRFPVALAFNRHGDLFASDQEGATWLPNGNPFDELLQIQRGRHYGFPPRHPKHLPSVIDEPSVFDYKPQHESTCGLTFNEPVGSGPGFGPKEWAGDALVCGYSRGTIYRTKLVPTSAGYVARTTLFARLTMLTVDSCVTPDGSLVVATHSGGPDWGSGPEGEGTLYKIRSTDASVPQPVSVWASSPTELRIAFDRPLNPERLQGLVEKMELTHGQFVAAGDRFESLRPGYETVAAQLAAPRWGLNVHRAEVAPDRRTLTLSVDAQTAADSYTLTMPAVGSDNANGTRRGLPQEPAVDLAYDLTGVQASWQSAAGVEEWTGWLPHPDIAVARAMSAGSAEHDRLWPLLKQAGTLTITSVLNLCDMLRPAVQPGSQVDDVLPREVVTLTFTGSGGIQARSSDTRAESGGTKSASQSAELTWGPDIARSVPLELSMTTGATEPRLEVTWHTAEDSRPRVLSSTRIFMPWARLGAETSPTPSPEARPELAGGNWLRGKAVFSSAEARCAGCHTVRGEGAKIGPDLSNLVHRDYTSVLRDIREPNYAINPDFITYSIALDDGRVLTGPIRTEGENLIVGDAEGKVRSIPRTDVEELKPSVISTMPDGLVQALGPERMKDLLTYLLTPGLEPAPIHIEGAPPPRSAAEVESVLKAVPPADSRRPLRIVLAGGPKDHGIDEHDYPLWQQRWEKLLGFAANVTVTTAPGWPCDDDFAISDVIVFYSANPGWTAEQGRQLDTFLERGGGLVYLHYAVNGHAAPEELAKRIGLAWRDGHSRFRHGALDLTFTEKSKSPIIAGFSTTHFVDESYWELIGDPARIDILATAPEDGQPRPLLWTRQQGRGRVFCSILGHYNWTFDDPLFRILVLRAIAWTASEPASRFHDLATIGARINAPN
jgi:putative heme-binding domain-containing protein